ncbi:MAG: exonuclease domain-containing protein [Nannocystaceae bacterium]|nr:3'-5' exonuclease [bacterium]
MTEASAPQESHATLSDAGVDLAALGERFSAFASGLQRPLVFFDVEATGVDPANDRIVELSILRVGSEGVEPIRTWRVKPGIRIPVEATEIHGISNEDVDAAPTFEQIADEVLALIDDCDLGGFAIGRFDVRIVQSELVRAGRAFDVTTRRVLDAQVIYHRREPRNLAAALQFYRGKELEGAHGAAADTVASLEVFAGQLERYADLSLDVDALHELSASHNDAYCDQSRRFQWRDNEPVFNFGRLRGRSLRWVASDPTERRYLRVFLEGRFEDDAKAIVRDALQGRIRQRKRTDTPAKSASS